MAQTTPNPARIAACKVAAVGRKRDAHGHFLKKPPPKNKTILLGNIHVHPEAGMILDPFEVLDQDTMILVEPMPENEE